MAKLRTGQKAERVTRFLLGVRDKRVAAALVKHGFSQQDLDEGWVLFRACVGERLAVEPAAGVDAEVLSRLDTWENRWFPVVRATLDRRYPAVSQKVFLNLSQTEGGEVIISVSALVERIVELETGTPEEQAARAVLTMRGLDADRIAEAQAMLAELGTVQPLPPVDAEDAEEAMQQAEEALWAWYLEWSAIARVAITKPSLLRLMGFRANRRYGSVDGDEVDVEDGAGCEADGDPGGEPGAPA